MKRRSILVVCALTCAMFTGPTFAFLGIGDIVFDPQNFEQAVRQLYQMQQQYHQLVETYRMIRSQYDHMVRMAKRVPVNMAVRYRALATPWHTSSAGNTYGTTAGWVNAVNTGAAVISGYARAIEALGTYGAGLGNIPADQLERVKTSYATVELTDGANLHSLETIGRLRANAPAVEAAIQRLEDDSLSADPDMNTEIAVLNKINAAGIVAIRSAQDTNKLLVALAEQQIVDSKRRRDAEARAINNHIRFVAEGKAVMAAQAAEASSAMLGWRMP